MKSLLAFLCVAGIVVGQTSQPAVTYKGKVRDAAWVNEKYEAHKDKLAVIDGKVKDIGGQLLEASEAFRYTPKVGDISYIGTRVTVEVARISGTKEIIARQRTYYCEAAKEFNIKHRGLVRDLSAFDVQIGNVNTSELKVGSRIDGKFVCVNAKGPVYEPLVEPTKEEFIEALNDGLRLMDYKMVITKRVKKVDGKKVTREFRRIVKKPVN